ncbi:MAG: NAD(P)/FAD-dependent oxidoreductase [Methanomicrobiales archaeon]|nr:NAD(P)/FAD-dependent oxidoreductase [Methanomicrobiales archaeon]
MIVVIGGGPAGRLGAMRLARAGREVTLVDRGGVGGQCLHHGCMVICALSDVARTLTYTRSLKDLGVLDAVPRVSFPALMAELRKIQDQIEAVLDEETRQAGVTVLTGREGRLNGRHVSIDGKDVKADAVLLATGSRPVIPEVEGGDLPGIVNAHTLGTLPGIPESLAIIGGGVMGAEYAYIFRALGSEVHLFARSGFLRDLDPRLREEALRELRGVHVHEHRTLVRFTGEKAVEAVVTLGKDGGADTAADAVILATGLAPNTGTIRGLDLGPLGEVVVDDRMQSSVPGVFAAGDVTGPPYLTPVARMEGMVAADNILGKDRKMDYRCIPQSLTLFHELAWCRRDCDGHVALGAPSPAGPGSFWSVPAGATGFTKVEVDPENGRLCSIAAAAPGASILVSYLAFLMREGYTAEDFRDFLEVHPSTDGAFSLIRFAEEWLRTGE